MSDLLRHRFVSPKLDGTDLTQVQPSAWNEGHRFQGGNDGDLLIQSTADATFGATWVPPAPPPPIQSYNPTWTLFGGSGLVLGNGSLLTRWIQQGHAVHLVMVLLGGSTTGWGTGGAYYAFSLPIVCTHQYEFNLVASLWSAAGAVLPATALGVDGSSFNLITTSGAPITPGTPASWWGPNARIEVAGTYLTP